jgi:hypothetical protein
MLAGIHGDLSRFLEGIGKGPPGNDFTGLYAPQGKGRRISLVVVDHKEEIPIGIIPDYLFSVPIGNIKETIPHGKIRSRYTPVPFKVIKGHLILKTSYIKGKKVFPGN